MVSNEELVGMFFHDIKSYNNTNFRSILKGDLTNPTPVVYKSLSSIITRFFIFAEHHPELSESDLKVLYFKLSIDKIARFFSDYPRCDYHDLLPFQHELQRYSIEEAKSEPLEGENIGIKDAVAV